MKALRLIFTLVPCSLATSSMLFGSTGSDDCAQAPISDAIIGSGTHTFDTTGTQLSAPMPCLSGPGGDVWFYWTATVTGTATVSTCNYVVGDSVLAVWRDGVPAGSCPTSLVNCSDDDCVNFQSSVTFSVLPGERFFLEFGAYGSGYSGTFRIDQSGIPGNDSCATPTAISGSGTFPFTTLGSTTGSQGQSEALCAFAGGAAIARDVWYAWTAPSTGPVTVSSCGGATWNTKVAVYAGAGCPTSPAIACDDDTCSLQSQVTFDASAGQAYTIQLGSPPWFVTGSGSFRIDLGTLQPACQYDDGSSENGLGVGSAGEFLALQRFDSVGPRTVGSISASIGPSWDTSLHGLPFRVAVWDDPNDDGLPYSDLVLLATGTGVISQTGAGSTWMQVDLVPPVVVTGVYFVGCSVVQGPQQWPGALDSSQTSSGRAFFAIAPGGSIDLAHPGNAPNGVRSLDAFGLGAYVWLLRSDCSPTGSLVCAGSAASCPCSNGGALGSGCANSFEAAGARLLASGDPSLLLDSVRLTASGMPSGAQPGFCTFAQSSSLSGGVVFGDGLSCLGGVLIRLGTRTTSNGSASFGGGIPGDPSVSLAGHVVAPGTRVYQVVYRNAAAFCTSATFNITNGFEVVWN